MVRREIEGIAIKGNNPERENIPKEAKIGGQQSLRVKGNLMSGRHYHNQKQTQRKKQVIPVNQARKARKEIISR
jgi:hypothetical protein